MGDAGRRARRSPAHDAGALRTAVPAGLGNVGLNQRRPAPLIDRVVAAVRVWREVFEEPGVSERDGELEKAAFRRAADVGMRAVLRHR
jgi:serine/threonine-protein kinase HipA